MKVLILYASRTGHTRRIAESLATAATARGWIPDLHDANERLPGHLAEFAAAILAAPIYMGHHVAPIVEFARRHRQTLEVVPTAFVSVSLTQAGADSTTLDAPARTAASEQLGRVLAAFVETTGWHPRVVHRVAGALLYTRYNWFVRWLMKRIAKSHAGAADTTRDHVYTDWDALDRFVGEFLGGVERELRGDVLPSP